MITSIEIDDKLWARAWALRTPKMTKRAFIEEALRTYARLHDQAKTKKLRGKLVWSGGFDDVRE